MHSINQVKDFHVPPDHKLGLNQIFISTQSPSCHIPSMNVVSHGRKQNITKHEIHRLNHLHPQAIVISPKPVQR